jgi:hypothetical protein
VEREGGRREGGWTTGRVGAVGRDAVEVGEERKRARDRQRRKEGGPRGRRRTGLPTRGPLQKAIDSHLGKMGGLTMSHPFADLWLTSRKLV